MEAPCAGADIPKRKGHIGHLNGGVCFCKISAVISADSCSSL